LRTAYYLARVVRSVACSTSNMNKEDGIKGKDVSDQPPRVMSQDVDEDMEEDWERM